MSQPKPQPYKVRHIHVVAKGDDVLVREYTLDPGEGTFYLRIKTEDNDGNEVAAGQTATVTPPTVHQVSNPTAARCRFLLIQGVGRYDFVPEAQA